MMYPRDVYFRTRYRAASIADRTLSAIDGISVMELRDGHRHVLPWLAICPKYKACEPGVADIKF